MPGKLVTMVSTLGRRCWDGLKHFQQSEPEMPAGFGLPSDLSGFHCRARIGREGRGDVWRSVLVVDIAGTIQAPAEDLEIDVRIALSDVTDYAHEPVAVLDRPKHGPLN